VDTLTTESHPVPDPVRDDSHQDRERERTIRAFARDKFLIHAVLFKHRHPNKTPQFHVDIIRLWHSPERRVLFMAFRGAGKSTLAEEAIVVGACYKDFRNGLILGETYERAVERLVSIKHEFETNPYLEDLFGYQVGPIWQEGKIVLQNGVIIQAFGRGQSLRGSKYLDQRPDYVFGDDMENDDAARTPDNRQRTREWFWGVVIPALDPNYFLRVAATPLDADALPYSLEKHAGFKTIRIPVYVYDETGREVPSWPDRFPISVVDERRKELYRLGLSHKWQQEYMCEAEDPQQKAFTPDLFRVKPQIKTWQACWAFFDPARTVKTTSATTGVAIWSWINHRLIVWDAYGKLWKPDEIIQDIFKVNELYFPVAIGVEPDGLEEFILQPLRHAQLKYGEVVPFRPIRAPRSKLDFIRGLQPFFKGGEVEFAKDLPDLVEQLLSFPTGRIDVPNALAYAVKMKPGLPIYDGFNVNRHIEESIRLVKNKRCYVAWNATRFCTTAVLFQFINGVLIILRDWVREGEPSQCVSYISSEIGLEIGIATAKDYAPFDHWKPSDTTGLRPALRATGRQPASGGDIVKGRQYLQGLLEKDRGNLPSVMVSTEARRVLNSFSGGYARALTKAGILTEEADDTIYKILMEGLESVMAFTENGDDDTDRHYEHAPDGRRYLSARV
jgi:hypothetical protein